MLYKKIILCRIKEKKEEKYALILGIIGIVCAVIAVFAPIGWILVIIVLIIGIVDVVKKGKRGEKRGVGIAGIVICEIMFIVLFVESMIFGTALLMYLTANKSIEESGLNVQEDLKQLFNSMYVNYEGTQTGSMVRVLLRMENSKAPDQDGHYVSYEYDGMVQDISTIFNMIKTTSEYRISLGYGTDGYVNIVKITPINQNV